VADISQKGRGPHLPFPLEPPLQCDNTFNRLFAPPTRTRHDNNILSCPCRRCEHNWRQRHPRPSTGLL